MDFAHSPASCRASAAHSSHLIGGALHSARSITTSRTAAFESIWPPHVLLFPFCLLFLVACASLASGFAEEILPAVIAGVLWCIAMSPSLYSFSRFFCSLASRWRKVVFVSEGSVLAPMRKFPGRFAASGVALAVFLLPIFSGFSSSEQSNFRTILSALFRHSKRS